MTKGAALEDYPPEQLPLVEAELQDTRHAGILRALYPGPIEIVAGDEVISRLLVQTVRHPGLSHVYAELVSDVGGSQIYIREEARLTGVSVLQLTHALPDGVLLGVVRPEGNGFRALLNPPDDLRLRTRDRIAVLARSYADAAPPDVIDPAPALLERPVRALQTHRRRRVLILGWNHRVPALLEEFAAYPGESFAIDIVSQISAAKRDKRVAAEGVASERLKVRQLEFDYTVPAYG